MTKVLIKCYLLGWHILVVFDCVMDVNISTVQNLIYSLHLFLTFFEFVTIHPFTFFSRCPPFELGDLLKNCPCFFCFHLHSLYRCCNIASCPLCNSSLKLIVFFLPESLWFLTGFLLDKFHHLFWYPVWFFQFLIFDSFCLYLSSTFKMVIIWSRYYHETRKGGRKDSRKAGR